MAQTGWPRIKEILDNSLERWKEQNGRKPALKVSHDGKLNWNSKEELAECSPFGLTLIESDKVGVGKATETNLVKILKRSIGGFRRMPSRGPYIPDEEIQEIVDWIDAGMPD
jgi:hypothetical protein